jgi:hypothetical protein
MSVIQAIRDTAENVLHVYRKVVLTLEQTFTIQSQLSAIRKENIYMAKSLADLQAAIGTLGPKLDGIDSSLSAIKDYEGSLGTSHDFTDEVNAVQALSDHVDAIKAKADSLSQSAAEGSGSDSGSTGDGNPSGDLGSGDGTTVPGSTTSADGTAQPPAI